MSNAANAPPNAATHPPAQASFQPLADVPFPQITWEDLTAAIDLAKAGPPPKVPDIPLSSLFAPHPASNAPQPNPVAHKPPPPPQQPSQPMQMRRECGQPSSIQPAFSPSLASNLKAQPAVTRPPPQAEQPVRTIGHDANKNGGKPKRKPKKQRRNSEPVHVSKQSSVLPITLESLREEQRKDEPHTTAQQGGKDAQWRGKEHQRQQRQHQPQPQHQPRPQQHPQAQRQPQPQQSQQPQHSEPLQQPGHPQQTAQHPAGQGMQSQQGLPQKATDAPQPTCPSTPVTTPAMAGFPPAQLVPFLNAAYQSYQANVQGSQAQHRTSSGWQPGQIPFSLPELSAAIQAAQLQVAQQQGHEASRLGIVQPTASDMHAAASDVPCHAMSQLLGVQGYNQPAYNSHERYEEATDKRLAVNGGIQKNNVRASDSSNWRRFPPNQTNGAPWSHAAQQAWRASVRHRPDGSFQPTDSVPPVQRMGGRNGIGNGNMMLNRNMTAAGDGTPSRPIGYNRGIGANRNMGQRRTWQPWRGGRARGNRYKRGGGRRYGGRRGDGSNPHGLPLSMTHGAFNLQKLVKQETVVNSGSEVNASGHTRS